MLVDNDGGGIFEFLPVAGEGDAFEEHVATPHGTDFAALAARCTAPRTCASPRPSRSAPRWTRRSPRRGTTIIHVRTDRAENVALHRAIWDAVRAAV